MNDQSDRRRSRLAIPMVIAVVAVIVALGAIVKALRSSPSEPTGVTETRASQPAAAQAVTTAAAAPTPGANDQQQSISKSLRISLKAAQDALKSKNYADAIAMLEAANGTPEKSPYDQHVINMFLSAAYAGVKDYDAAAMTIEAELKDGFLTPAQIEKQTIAAALLHYQVKDYDKAIEFGNRAIRSGSTNRQISTVVLQAYYLKGDWSDAVQFDADFVNRQIVAGGTPEKLVLDLWFSACLKLRDNSCETRALDKLVAYYPTPQIQRELERLRAAR